ncbi:hypothetical protein WMY93_028313 [Mugilogobius chulae]|uniref:Reverse transcriptase domain-containing protein n=1 Tax=Mugilogobius chulae TaxID=88201 RepID=A0AAW0MWQ7_9GOBI
MYVPLLRRTFSHQIQVRTHSGPYHPAVCAREAGVRPSAARGSESVSVGADADTEPCHTSTELSVSVEIHRGLAPAASMTEHGARDCTTTKTSNAIVKFADDTVVVGLISNNNEAAYFEEVALLSTWCKENNLVINVSKTKEIVVDPRRGKERTHQTQLNIKGATVERVPTYKYLGDNIAEDMKWDQHISSVVRSPGSDCTTSGNEDSLTSQWSYGGLSTAPQWSRFSLAV